MSSSFFVLIEAMLPVNLTLFVLGRSSCKESIYTTLEWNGLVDDRIPRRKGRTGVTERSGKARVESKGKAE